MHIPTVFATTGAVSILAEEIKVAPLIVELVFFLLLLVGFFVFRSRTMKVLSACGAEFCLWLASKAVFAKDSWIITLMTWITAFAIVCVSITVVNRINWGGLRGEKK